MERICTGPHLVLVSGGTVGYTGATESQPRFTTGLGNCEYLVWTLQGDNQAQYGTTY
jgi:hypothetical protein